MPSVLNRVKHKTTVYAATLSSVARISVIALDISTLVFKPITPELCRTTYCAKSNTPIMMSKACVAITTAAHVLNKNLKNINVSISDEYYQGGFSDEIVNTLRMSRIHRVFRTKWLKNG